MAVLAFHAFELRRCTLRRVDEAKLRTSPDPRVGDLSDRAGSAAAGGATAQTALHLREQTARPPDSTILLMWIWRWISAIPVLAGY